MMELVTELITLIELANKKNVAFFPTYGTYFDELEIQRAEELLSAKLPNSYRWFLKCYGSGEILGDEIYSIYQRGNDYNLDDLLPGGDILYQNRITDNSSLKLSENDIIFLNSDFSETFFFKDQSIVVNETIYVSVDPKSKPIVYAKDFYDFLRKKLNEMMSF